MSKDNQRLNCFKFKHMKNKNEDCSTSSFLLYFITVYSELINSSTSKTGKPLK